MERSYILEETTEALIPSPGEIDILLNPELGSSAAVFDIWEGSSLHITNGYTFNPGTQVINAGTLELTGGTFDLNHEVNLGGQAQITGGILTGTHTLSGNIVVNGGVFDGNGITTIASDGAVEFAHPEDNPLERTFVNEGNIIWSDGDMTGSATDGTLGASATGFTVTNNGTFQKTAGESTTTVNAPFTTNGIVRADTGILHFADSFNFDNGLLALGGGQVTLAQTLSFPSTSALTGNGTIIGNVETSGFVSPGNSIGSLSITGDLTLLPDSNSFFEVDADSDPKSVDLVSVSGNLVLGGTLSWNQLSALDPISTDMFTLFTANNLTGHLLERGARLSTANGHRSFIVNYGTTSIFDTNSVVFSDFEFTPVPEPSTWALLMTGLFLVGWQGRRRRIRK